MPSSTIVRRHKPTCGTDTEYCCSWTLGPGIELIGLFDRLPDRLAAQQVEDDVGIEENHIVRSNRAFSLRSTSNSSSVSSPGHLPKMAEIPDRAPCNLCSSLASSLAPEVRAPPTRSSGPNRSQG